jgi:RNase H-like domain found in reverse transcriptase/Chromo (CHRromatin Organisation MOdifier) domain
MQIEDHLAEHDDDPPPSVFDPDNVLTQALLSQLASATSASSQVLCQPFVRSGTIVTNTNPISFNRGLLDTGAQGSNFISRQLYESLPSTITEHSRSIDRVVRLGDARSLSIQLEVPLTVNILDSTDNIHQHTLWYSVLDVLSHDLIIGLVDLIGPFYELFADSVTTSRQLSLTSDLGTHLVNLTAAVQTLHCTRNPKNIVRATHALQQQTATYLDRKSRMCNSTKTHVQLLALQDGTTADVLTHPRLGHVFADNRVETRYDVLTALLSSPSPGDIIQPWSKPVDSLAPEELETPDPTSFPDDILAYLTTTPQEARSIYTKDLDTHITPAMRNACPAIIELLQSDLAYDVFVPSTWKGIDMPSYHLDVKPGMPDFLKARARPVREALYKDAKIEFDRMRTYFYETSTSPIACPLVIAPKATAPFIRLCGDYRPINPFISIPQEPIPHVQQSLAKAAGWNVFVDLDMTNSFHQIPIDDFSSNLLSVSTPWGLFRPKFLPEGVGPASGILQSIVRRIFADFDDWIIVIFDNFLVLASDYQDAITKLELVLRRCQLNGLVLKMKKSWIGTDVVTFFGYEVHPGKWQLSDTRKAAISAMIFPTTQKQMQSFLGAANFFHTHIPNFASWASALYECTVSGFNWDPSTWKTDYKNLFNLFKVAITESVTLHFPDYTLPWVIRSDSSDHAVGAVLFQEFTDSHGAIIHQPIAFASHKYSGAAINWDTFKQEAYALYFSVMQFGYYLRGKPFLLETDHRNLVWIESSQVPIVVRWRVLLQSYIFEVKHIPGKENTVADWLSRMYPTHPVSPSLSAISTPLTITDMFNAVHGGRSLHHGAKRTYLALCRRFPGHGIPLRVVQDLVTECPICQKDRLPMQHIDHNEVRETLFHHPRSIGMDHVTVTPPDEDGYIGLLLIVELDTKFPQAYPIRDYTAYTAATVLFKHYCTFGTYDSLYSDPGSAFTATVLDHLNQWIGIPHHVSLIGRHESNGTEHVNGLFLGHLRRLVHDERFTHKWASDTVLPLINHAMMTLPNTEIGGLSPAELKFGTRDHARFQLPPPLSPGHTYGDLVIALDRNLAIVRSITSAYQDSLRQHRQSNSPPDSHNRFQPGDFVLWNPLETPHSFRSNKLSPKLLGPYKVIEQIKNDITCQHVVTNIVSRLHASRVTPYFGTPDTAYTTALLDRDEYIVDFIITHRGNPRKISTLEFLVRWQNYSSEHDTWEPWIEMKKVSAVHLYLQSNNMSHIIPRQFVQD